METVASGWPSVVQTVFLALISALIPVLALWVKSHLDRIEKKVVETKVVADKTHILSNSATMANLELLVTAYRLLVSEDPDNEGYKAQLETSVKNLAAHQNSQAKVDAMPIGQSEQSPSTPQTVIVQKVKEPVEIKTK